MIIAEDNRIKIEKLTLGEYETNAYIIVCMKTKESMIIDAPADADVIIAALENTKPQAILLTHDHFDHTGALEELRLKLKVPLATHEFSSFQIKTPPEMLLRDGDEIKLGKLKIDVLFTPGHTAGSLCFKVEDYLLAGDTVFPGGPGHTDMPEYFTQIVESITQKIYALPDQTIILPGHGESTTVKKSKEEYMLFAIKPHGELCGDITWTS